MELAYKSGFVQLTKYNSLKKSNFLCFYLSVRILVYKAKYKFSELVGYDLHEVQIKFDLEKSI